MVQSSKQPPEGIGSLWTIWLTRTIAHELVQTVRPRAGGAVIASERRSAPTPSPGPWPWARTAEARRLDQESWL